VRLPAHPQRLQPITEDDPQVGEEGVFAAGAVVGSGVIDVPTEPRAEGHAVDGPETGLFRP
jgi:hypothetical protein